MPGPRLHIFSGLHCGGIREAGLEGLLYRQADNLMAILWPAEQQNNRRTDCTAQSARLLFSGRFRRLYAGNVGNGLQVVGAGVGVDAVDPAAAGEIRDGHRRAAQGDGFLAQAGDGHPGRRVVGVDGHAGAVFHALYKGAEHQVIHAVMASPHPLGLVIFPQGMLIGFPVLISRLPGMGFGHALYVQGMVVLHPSPLGALDPQTTGIGAGQGGVMDEQNGFPVGAFDHGGHHVPLGEGAAHQVGVVAFVGGDPAVQPHSLGGHGGQGDQPVALVDVQQLGDGAELVGGVDFPVPV